MGKTTLVNGLFTRLCRFTRRLGGNERGNVAMIFAFSLPVLAMMSLGGIVSLSDRRYRVAAGARRASPQPVPAE